MRSLPFRLFRTAWPVTTRCDQWKPISWKYSGMLRTDMMKDAGNFAAGTGIEILGRIDVNGVALSLIMRASGAICVSTPRAAACS